jgi:signal transduction histidine kinase
MNILIVDDHPTNLKLLRAQLEAEGMTVLEACDGMEALAVLERGSVGAVISDVLMPNMDGYQLCHAMRKNARFNPIPCILYSNTFASESNRELGLEFGADLFLKKPAPVETILGALNELILKGGRQPRKEVKTIQHLQDSQPYSEHLIHELERQNAKSEETKQRLLKVNHKLLLRTRRLEKLEAGLRETNEELERRVGERTAELEVANEELAAFSYSVSHDLRAPLRAIRGFSQILLGETAGRLDEAGRGHLQHVIGATNEMSQLIDAMLSLARVTRADLIRRPVDLSAIAQIAIDKLKQGASDRATKVVIQPDLVATADAQLLGIVLTNLLGNAWKFSRKTASPCIELGGREADGVWTFFVRDNGAGFDMAYADRLFGAFQRLHSAEDFEGTGIGLATVQRIIHRHGGRIWAESVPLQGTTFYFTLTTSGLGPIVPFDQRSPVVADRANQASCRFGTGP